MQALAVLAHPSAESFNMALFDTAVKALRAAGHEVEALDLYREGFRPEMSREERVAYHSDEPIVSAHVARHAEAVAGADMLVFVYPTWWFGLPAVLEGWLERVLVPGVGFVFHPDTHRVTPNLRRVRRIVGISTYGATWAYTKLFNDAGRRTLLRGLRLGCTGRAAVTWLAMYGMDTSTHRQRTAFLARVERKLSKL
ncbi:MAG: NAD(P)H-dependent oxidoreductase [Acidimicrobiia bacterium]